MLLAKISLLTRLTIALGQLCMPDWYWY